MPDALQPITSANAPRYRYYMVDIVTNKIVGEIPLEDVSYERSLKQPGSFEGKITVSEQTNALDLYNATMPGKTALYVVRDTEAVWGGIIWGRTYDLVGRSLAVSASEFTSYLNHRIVWKTFSHSYSVTLSKTASSPTPYFYAAINNVTLRSAYSLTDEFGKPTKVEITFVDPKLRKYSGFYELRGTTSNPAALGNPTQSGFYVHIPNLPMPKSGVYPNVGMSAKTDTYSYLRDLLGNVFRDFVDIDFVNDVIEPGIKEAIEVKYMELTLSNPTNGVAKITTETEHGLVVGQRIEVSNLASWLDGVHTVSSVPTTTTFEYILANPVSPLDNSTPLILQAIPANTVPVTERTPVTYRQVLRQFTEYITSIKRESGYTTIKFNSIHPFTVGQRVVITIAPQRPALRTINGKSVNIFDYKKVQNVMKIDSITDYTISFQETVATGYTSSVYDLKESNVLKPAENFVKNAGDTSLLQLSTKTDLGGATGTQSRGYNIGNKIRVVGVDAPTWNYPIYNGYHSVLDVSPGTPRTISTYTVTTATNEFGNTYSYVELVLAGNAGFTEGDYILVDGLTGDPQLDGEYQLIYAAYSSGSNTTTIRYAKNANAVALTNAPSGATASLNGNAWVIYQPSNSEIRYSLKSEPDSISAIASLKFEPATPTKKNSVTITTQARHSISVGDVVVVDFGTAEKGKDTKTYGGRVVVTSVGDLDQISYTLSGKRELPIPKVKLDETPKTGSVTRKIKSVQSTPSVEAKFASISSETDANGGVLVTAYGIDHDLNVGDYIVVEVDDPTLAAFENENVPARVESVSSNSFTYSAEFASKLNPIPSGEITKVVSRLSSGIPILELDIKGVVDPVVYPQQTAKIVSVDLTEAESAGRVVYTYDKTTTTTLASGGASGTNTFVIPSVNALITKGLTMTGTGIPANTLVLDVTGTTITANKLFTSQVTGTVTFDPTINSNYNATFDGFVDPVATTIPAVPGSGSIASVQVTPYDGNAYITFTSPHNLDIQSDKNWNVSNNHGMSINLSGFLDMSFTEIWWRHQTLPNRFPDISAAELYELDSIPLGYSSYKKVITSSLSYLNGTTFVTGVYDAYTISVYAGPGREAAYSATGGASASWAGTAKRSYPEGKPFWSSLNSRLDITRVDKVNKKIYVTYKYLAGNSADLGLLGVVDVSADNITGVFPEFTQDETKLPDIVVGDFVDISGFINPDYTILNNSGPHEVTGTNIDLVDPTIRKVRFRNTLPTVKGVQQTVTYTKTLTSTDSPKLLVPAVATGTAYLDYSKENDEVFRITSASRSSSTPALATITTADEHGLETGDYANIWVYGKGLAAFNQKNTTVVVTRVSATQFTYALNAPTKIQYYSVFRKVATISFNGFAPHNFFIGDTVSISNVATNVNGTRVITSVGPASITFAVPNITETVRTTAVKGTISLTTPVSKTATINTAINASSMGQVLQAPTIYREPSIFVRSWGEFPGSADIGGLTFSTNAYSGQDSTNSPLYGSALATVADVLDKYSNSLTGFEYRIDVSLGLSQSGEKEFKRQFVLIPLYPPTLTDYLNSLPGKKLAKGQAADPAAFGADKTIFEYPGNITNVSVAENAQNSATRIFVNNKNNKAGEGIEAAYSAATSTELLADGWPLLDRADTVDWPQGAGTDSAVSIDKWGNHDNEQDFHKSAQRFLQESKPPSGDIVITVNGSLNPVVGSYNPGEWCSIIVRDNFLKNRLGTALEPRKDMFVRRIDAIKVKVPNNPAFPEQIDLTLVPDWQVDKVGE
jgi:hypothetical protein